MGRQVRARRERPQRSRRVASRRVKAALGDSPLYLAATHTYRGDDRARIAALAALGERCGTPIVATNDVLYHAPDRRPLQDVLTCIREKTTHRRGRSAARGQRRAPPEARCRDGAAVPGPRSGPRAHARDRRGLPLLARRTRLRISRRARARPARPRKRIWKTSTWEGARWRFPDGVPDKVRALIEKELALIAELNYAPYFLTVHDIVASRARRSILCQGRGSAANSAVCYCLGITAVNPTEIDLLFERFISAERNGAARHRRRFRARAARGGDPVHLRPLRPRPRRHRRDRHPLPRTLGRARRRQGDGASEDTVAALAGMVWGTTSGGELPEKHVRDAGLDPADPTAHGRARIGARADGLSAPPSQHVGGFVLTRGPLVEVVPVGNAAMADRTFIEWDKDDIDALGLMKVDVLALGMLTCIRKRLRSHREARGQEPDARLAAARGRRPSTTCCASADSLGVFQVESRAQMNMLPRLKPRCFYDLVIEVAIVRPGPIQGDMVHPYLRRRAGVEPEHLSLACARTWAARTSWRTSSARPWACRCSRSRRCASPSSRRSSPTPRSTSCAGPWRRSAASAPSGFWRRRWSRAWSRAAMTQDFAQRCFNADQGLRRLRFSRKPRGELRAPRLRVGLDQMPPPGGVRLRAAELAADGLLRAGADRARRARARRRSARSRRESLRLGLHAWRTAASGEPAGICGSACARSTACRRRRRARSSPSSLSRRRTTCGCARACRLDTLEKLAAADAFRSLGLDRRQALWEVKALASAEPLPLFAWSETREAGHEPEVALPAMALSEHVVNDYQTLRLSLKAHPMCFLREDFARRRPRVSLPATSCAAQGWRLRVALPASCWCANGRARPRASCS